MADKSTLSNYYLAAVDAANTDKYPSAEVMSKYYEALKEVLQIPKEHIPQFAHLYLYDTLKPCCRFQSNPNKIHPECNEHMKKWFASRQQLRQYCKDIHDRHSNGEQQ
jgi:hypothetical protein